MLHTRRLLTLFRDGGALGVEMLQDSYRNLTLLQCSYSFGCGASSGNRGKRWDAMSDRRSPDCLLVEPGILSLRGVDYKLNTIALD